MEFRKYLITTYVAPKLADHPSARRFLKPQCCKGHCKASWSFTKPWASQWLITTFKNSRAPDNHITIHWSLKFADHHIWSSKGGWSQQGPRYIIYEELQELSSEVIHRMNLHLPAMCSKGQIRDWTVMYLATDIDWTQQFYLLPKCIKYNIIPGRSIVSGSEGPTK